MRSLVTCDSQRFALWWETKAEKGVTSGGREETRLVSATPLGIEA